MSDGMTEGARDQWRAEGEALFLDRLADHLEGPSDATWHALREAAEAVDGVRGGFGSSPTHWSKDLGDLATGLLTGDGPTWARMIRGLAEGAGLSYGPGQRLHALSPWAGKAIVTYKSGRLGGDYGAAFRSAVVGAGMDPKGAYLIVLPEDAVLAGTVVPTKAAAPVTAG